jgi:hypothetical protein
MPDLEQIADAALPSPDEQTVAYQYLGVCMHLQWTRSTDEYAQYASCPMCGERIFLSGNFLPG